MAVRFEAETRGVPVVERNADFADCGWVAFERKRHF